MPAVGLPVHAEHVGVVGQSRASASPPSTRGDEHIAEPAADAADERDLPAVRRERGARVADVRGRRVRSAVAAAPAAMVTISMCAGDANVAAPAVIASDAPSGDQDIVSSSGDAHGTQVARAAAVG